MEWTESLTALGPAALAGLGVILLIELGLLAWGVIDWAKRPPEQVRGNRVLWLVLMVLVNIIGPVLYLTIGRLPKTEDAPFTPAAPDETSSAVDALYGTGQDGPA